MFCRNQNRDTRGRGTALACALLAATLLAAACSDGTAAGDTGAAVAAVAASDTGDATDSTGATTIAAGGNTADASSIADGAIAGAAVTAASAAGAELGVYSRDFFALDTIISVMLYAHSEQEAGAALDGVEALYGAIHEKMTRFADESLATPGASQIYAINAGAGGDPVPVDGETFDLLKRALEYCALSGGAFDIGIGAVSDLWDFNEGSGPPTDAELSHALGRSGYRNVGLHEGEKAVSLAAGMKLDLGGIAKGYATQESAELLRRMGIAHAIINAGGNVYALGGKPAAGAGGAGGAATDGAGGTGGAASAGADSAGTGSAGAPNTDAPWKVGIKHPRAEGELLAAISVKDQAVVTSGDYEKYFEWDGKRYHHILDPKTGRPATGCVSVTIVTGDSTLADYLSTAAFVLGPEAGMALVESFPDTYAIFVDSDFGITVSQGLEDRVAFY